MSSPRTVGEGKLRATRASEDRIGVREETTARPSAGMMLQSVVVITGLDVGCDRSRTHGQLKTLATRKKRASVLQQSSPASRTDDADIVI